MPHGRNPLLKHHESWIARIEADLGTAGATALSQPTAVADISLIGQGGLGKTAMAVEYAWRHASNYPGGVYWLAGDRPLSQALRAMAEGLGWAVPDKITDPELINLVLARMRAHTGLKLIVLDNLDTGQIPGQLHFNQAHLLVTTRQTDVGLGTISLELPLEDEARDIFWSYADTHDTQPTDRQVEAIGEICRRVDRLPVALEILGKVARRVPVVDLCADLQDVMHHSAPVHTKAESSIDAAMSVVQKRFTGRRGQEALRYIAYLDPELITAEVLALTMKTSVKRAGRTLAKLAGYSVVQGRPDGGYSVHRLIQEVGRLGDHRYRVGQKVAERLDRVIQEVSKTGTYKDAYPLIPHLIHLADLNPEADEKEDFPNANALSREAKYLKDSGFYVASEKIQRIVVSRVERAKGKEHLYFATNLNNLALLLDAQGKYDEAEGLFRQALDIDGRTIGQENSHYAAQLNNLAGVLENQGKYDEAEGLFRQALDIAERTIGKEHPDYSTHLNNLAGVLENQGKYDEAERLYRQALDIGERTIGKEHPSYALRLNNLAGLLRAQSKYDEAERLYRQALDIDQRTIGQGHPSYALRLNNLAWVLRDQGEYNEAEKNFLAALEISRRALGPDHPQTKAIEENLAGLRAKMAGQSNQD